MMSDIDTSKELKDFLFQTPDGKKFLANERLKFASIFTGEIKQNLLNKTKEVCSDSSSSVRYT